jgi:hypothetical protein
MKMDRHVDGRTDRQTDRRKGGQTDGQTDMMTLIVAFPNFANAPKKHKTVRTSQGNKINYNPVINSTIHNVFLIIHKK